MRIRKVYVLLFVLFVLTIKIFAGTASLGTWRWRNDNGNQENATWMDDENTSITLDHNDNIRLRIEIYDTGTGTLQLDKDGFPLQYSIDQTNWIPITTSETNHFVINSSEYFDTLDSTTDELTYTIHEDFQAGYMFDSEYTGEETMQLNNGFRTEFEYCIKKTDNALPGTTYFFQYAINDGDNYATLLTAITPLPVTLSSFTAAYINSASTLSWTTQSESSNQGWNVYRSETENIEEGNIQNADLINGAGTTSEPSDYTFNDPYPATEGLDYWFWIESISFSGESEIFGPVTLSVPNTEPDQYTPIIPETFGLYQNYPNPFNPITVISFALQEAGNCELVIYNVKGRKIKTLFTGNIEADRVYNFIWNGEDRSGKAVSSGIYYYKMKAGTYSSTKKMILLK